MQESDAPAGSTTAKGTRPFYRLYLMSEAAAAGSPAEAPRGEGGVVLRRAPARSCGRLLEIAFLPSAPPAGSDRLCYLLYEDTAAFVAARALAAHVDTAALRTGRPGLTGAERFEHAVSLFYGCLEFDGAPDAERIDGCIAELDGVAADESLERGHRWLAAVLAGWLCREERNDGPAALERFRRAAEAAESGSLERLSARWHEAQTLGRDGGEGELSAARRIYEAIEREFGDRLPENRMVKRAAMMDQ